MFFRFTDAMARILASADNPRKIVAGLSGGVDSATLLHLLSRWRKKPGNDYEIVAAHLNHGLRGEVAREDRDFSRELAESFGTDFVFRDVDAGAAARKEGLGLEAAGRLLRYRFFAELAAGGGTVVLTGHHADDQIETILLHLHRGAHRRGLGGMREFIRLPVPPRPPLALGRPLLGFAREEIVAYAREHSLVWREDATNRDLACARNRTRHRILPILERLSPGFGRRLLARAELLRLEEDRLCREGGELLHSLAESEDSGLFFRVTEIALARTEALAHAFRQIVEEMAGGLLPNGNSLARLMILAASGRTGASLTLPGGLEAWREADGIFFTFPNSRSGGMETEIILPEAPFAIESDGLAVTAELLPSAGRRPPADSRDPESEWLDPSAVHGPLRLRRPRPGERFRPLGAPGRRKIQDILTDLKIPRRRRSRALVLADDAGTLWLWPWRLADRARLPDQPIVQALRIRISLSASGKAAR
ncbi:MAG: tRNA lysidine(34) synthetase TilS [Planctomycetota bacterium]|jgi:tRNA(Ile)-lysidine synthase|nr:tRNA lysidine(34) synthetase TilS [Planctomycetota bacterium]